MIYNSKKNFIYENRCTRDGLKVLKGSKTILKHKMPIIFEYEDIFEKKFNYKFDDYVKFVNEINYKFETVFKNNFLIIPK